MIKVGSSASDGQRRQDKRVNEANSPSNSIKGGTGTHPNHLKNRTASPLGFNSLYVPASTFVNSNKDDVLQLSGWLVFIQQMRDHMELLRTLRTFLLLEELQDGGWEMEWFNLLERAESEALRAISRHAETVETRPPLGLADIYPSSTSPRCPDTLGDTYSCSEWGLAPYTQKFAIWLLGENNESSPLWNSYRQQDRWNHYEHTPQGRRSVRESRWKHGARSPYQRLPFFGEEHRETLDTPSTQSRVVSADIERSCNVPGIRERRQEKKRERVASLSAVGGGRSAADVTELEAHTKYRTSRNGDAQGRYSLNLWRNRAGKSKSWKRQANDNTTSRSSQRNHVACRQKKVDRMIDKPLVWIPLAFARSYRVKRRINVEGLYTDQAPSRLSLRLGGADCCPVYGSSMVSPFNHQSRAMSRLSEHNLPVSGRLKAKGAHIELGPSVRRACQRNLTREKCAGTPAVCEKTRVKPATSLPIKHTKTNGSQRKPKRPECHKVIRAASDTVLVPHIEEARSREFKNRAVDYTDANPPNFFLRFTCWKDEELPKIALEAERFVPSRLIFSSRWLVDCFLRNDNHADVYSVHDTAFYHPDFVKGAKHEAHVFLAKYQGNCECYAKRQQKRMRASTLCRETFWYGDKHVFIMSRPAIPVTFDCGLSETKFPALIDRERGARNIALQRNMLRGKPSYAAMAGGTPSARELAPSEHGLPATVAIGKRGNHDGWTVDPGQDIQARSREMLSLQIESTSALEIELERLERARLIKMNRQKLRRQSKKWKTDTPENLWY